MMLLILLSAIKQLARLNIFKDHFGSGGNNEHIDFSDIA